MTGERREPASTGRPSALVVRCPATERLNDTRARAAAAASVLASWVLEGDAAALPLAAVEVRRALLWLVDRIAVDLAGIAAELDAVGQ